MSVIDMVCALSKPKVIIVQYKNELPGGCSGFGDMTEASSTKPQRRRPRQSRARATADAIRQAFIQLLVEKGYEKVSIRQVIALAGVGIGSFYEYFSSKSALAAVCVHLSIKDITVTMRDRINATRHEPLPARVDALLEAQSAAPVAEPEQWAALFLLERQVSSIDAYRRLYAEFVQLWEEGLTAGSDWPANAPTSEAAFAAHAMTYSLVAQALMTSAHRDDPMAMRRLLRSTVHGYLSVLVPQAYRLHRFDH
jgi:AcrR family transcriptional regulator